MHYLRLILFASILLLCGCTRTILVPPGTAVRLRASIRNARVWILDAQGAPVAGKVTLPAGWFCLPKPEN